MTRFTYPLHGNTAVVEVHGAVADAYRQDPTYTEVLSEEEVEELKARELDAELSKRRLSRKGRADEKRARLLEQQEAETARLVEEEARRSAGGVPAQEAPALLPPAVQPIDATADRDAAHAALTEEN
jgi:hypothetical protein